MSFAEEEQKQERKTVSSIPEKVLTTVLNGEQEGEKRYVGKDFCDMLNQQQVMDIKYDSFKEGAKALPACPYTRMALGVLYRRMDMHT